MEEKVRWKFGGRHVRRYFDKIMFAQLRVLYITVIVFWCVFATINQAVDLYRLRGRENALFQEAVDQCDLIYSELTTAASDVKTLRSLHFFALTEPKRYYARMTEFQQELERFSVSYHRRDIRFAVLRFGESLVVTDSSSQELSQLLSSWGMTQENFDLAVTTLIQEELPGFLVWTDDYVFFFSQQNYVTDRVLILCYAPMQTLEFDNGSDTIQISFDSTSPAVLDLRTQDLALDPVAETERFPDLPLDQIQFVPGTGQDLRLLHSRFYDICYMGQVTNAHLPSTLLLIMLITLGPVLLILYFISRRVSQNVYRPIGELSAIVLGSQDAMDAETNQVAQITNKVRLLKEENSELQKRLDSLSHDILLTQQSAAQTPEEEECIDPDAVQIRLREYVLNHLSQDISLSDIAEEFGISFSYMSVLFKNKMDSNFKEYLSYQRYLRALDLMREDPARRIKDIASQVGIQNVNTFIRIFKKYSGTTPKQFLNREFHSAPSDESD